jgi:thiosulfate/3-mercaptopyruvate sulfurtransferase
VIPPFVDAAWLAENRDAVVLADVRWYLDGRSGAAAFEAGHLPGAVFVDLDRWLAARADPRRGRSPAGCARRASATTPRWSHTTTRAA